MTTNELQERIAQLQAQLAAFESLGEVRWIVVNKHDMPTASDWILYLYKSPDRPREILECINDPKNKLNSCEVLSGQPYKVIPVIVPTKNARKETRWRCADKECGGPVAPTPGECMECSKTLVKYTVRIVHVEWEV